eukprot:gene10899-22751_t
MDIGTAWTEVTMESTTAQIEDICLSLLRSYVNWKRAVMGTAALCRRTPRYGHPVRTLQFLGSYGRKGRRGKGPRI